MFSDDVLEKIFNDPDVREVPLIYQSKIIHAIENILEKEEEKEDKQEE